MSGIGFDNAKYLSLQSEKIRERIARFGGKLYLEFGGKLFDDHHASRVLPGFEPDSKIRMLQTLKDQVEIVLVIGEGDADVFVRIVVNAFVGVLQVVSFQNGHEIFGGGVLGLRILRQGGAGEAEQGQDQKQGDFAGKRTDTQEDHPFYMIDFHIYCT